MVAKPGVLVISLDFELFWGVRDNRSIEDYKENLLGGRLAIPQILDLFDSYNIHATWATVGFLCFDQKTELVAACEMQLFISSLISPFYLWKNGYLQKMQ